jgi:ferredoxin-type protein NapH
MLQFIEKLFLSAWSVLELGKKRKIIQIISMLIYNADVKNYFTGRISKSQLKNICVPGLNCYSCPGSVSACPLGSLQSTIANGKFPFFITGMFLLLGTLFGRAICAFLCPFGLIQEILYKIPFFKIKQTDKTKRISRIMSLLKYFFLAVLCIIFPIVFFFKDGVGSPFFCKLICPEGTIFAGWPLVLLNESFRSSVGFLFTWKSILAFVIIILSLSIYRPFCKYICPLGAIYSFFNKIAIVGISVDETKCTHCNACTVNCKMNAVKVNDRECIRCAECLDKCKFNALNISPKIQLIRKKK